MNKTKKTRLIILPSILIGLSIAIEVYKLLFDDEMNSTKFMISSLPSLGVIISMGIIINSIVKRAA